MIEIPMFVWVSITLYILTGCLKNLGSIATSAKLLQAMEARRPNDE